ncbi:MAG: methyltransferase [Deltaproteobacteria bacterium]|nr:MAG: methyltransferase [Deltaproteobacteria bacterium]
MTRAARSQIRAYGVRVLLSRHPEVRKLKRANTPSAHGNKVWKSSWILMDYFNRRGLKEGARVMELGCGWGLAGIYCAKKHAALVTAVDIDPEVFPYLKLHANLNQVRIATMKKGFAGVTGEHLKAIDVLIGSDICFWDELIDQLKRLFLRALRAGVRQVIIADPGRSSFEKIGEYFVRNGSGVMLDWTAQRPRRSQGRILRIGSIDNTSASG